MSSQPEPEIVELEPVSAVVVSGDAQPMDALAGFFDRSFALLADAIAVGHLEPIGPAFAHYRTAPTDVADLSVGFPVAQAREVPGTSVLQLPAGRVARLVHQGSYDELGSAWQHLGTWAHAQGHSAREGAGMWEVYLTEPSPDMDPADLRTELNLPLA